MKAQQLLMVLLLILSIGLGIYSLKLKEENNYLKDSKNFHSSWSPSQEVLMSYWKNNNKLSDQYIDRNFDNNYEVINTYTTYGKIIQIGYDENENGVVEKSIIFNSTGEKIGVNNDYDEDRDIDEFTLIYKNNSMLTFTDENNDGRYEKMLLKINNKVSEITIKNMFEQYSDK